MLSAFIQLTSGFSALLIFAVIVGLCLFNSMVILIATFQVRRGDEKVYSIGLPILR